MPNTERSLTRRDFLKAFGIFTLGGIGIGTGFGTLGRSAVEKASPAGAAPEVTPTSGSTGTPKPTESPTSTATASPTAESTATASPTATQEPTPVPYESPKPTREETFGSGSVEKYGMITEQNTEKYFSYMTRGEFEKLQKEQPDRILFPFSPKGKFSMGVLEAPNGLKYINIYGADVSVFAPRDAANCLAFNTGLNAGIGMGDDSSKPSYWGLQINTSSPNPKLKFDANLSDSFEKAKPRKQGDHLFDFSGADAFNNEGKYSSPENRLGFNMVKITIIDPGKQEIWSGREVTVNQVTKTENLTPPFTDLDKWLTKDGKIAVMQR